MTPPPEDEYIETVAAYLSHHYAPEVVEQEPTLSSGNEPDFIVTPVLGGPFAIEVENTSVEYESIGQAFAYASELDECRPDDAPFAPTVITPDHSVPDERRGWYLRGEATYLSVPVDWAP